MRTYRIINNFLFGELTKAPSFLWLAYGLVGALSLTTSCKPSPNQTTNSPRQTVGEQVVIDDCPYTHFQWDSLRQRDPQSYHQCLSTRIEGLQAALPPPIGNDWLAQHSEKGQTFEAYKESRQVNNLVQPIYLKRIGNFEAAQIRLLDSVGVYLSIFFQRPVSWIKPLSISDIPKTAQRQNPNQGQRQIQTMYLLNEVLKKEIPENASILLGFSSEDLYPSANWNYVFGQASLSSKVGVWSIYRFGDPSFSKESFQTCFMRAIKTATHEAGHMYGIKHCIYWKCNMNGSNHLRELDGSPNYYCPEDWSKLGYHLKWKDGSRIEQLRDFWARQEGQYDDLIQYYTSVLNKLGGTGG